MALSQRRRRRFRNEAERKRLAETSRIDATQQSEPEKPDESAQIGGRGTYAASGLTAVEDALLEGKAIKSGWAGSVFPVEQRWQDLQKEVVAAGGPTLTQHLTLSVHKGLEAGDPRRIGIAERNGIHMVALNQAKDLKSGGASNRQQQQVNINVGLLGLPVDERRTRLLAIAGRFGIDSLDGDDPDEPAAETHSRSDGQASGDKAE